MMMVFASGVHCAYCGLAIVGLVIAFMTALKRCR